MIELLIIFFELLVLLFFDIQEGVIHFTMFLYEVSLHDFIEKCEQNLLLAFFHPNDLTHKYLLFTRVHRHI